MNRLLVILSLILLMVVGYFLMINEVRGYGIIVLLLGTLVTILRRTYLGISPWWGGNLKDIPKYFRSP
ncbi:MAG: hypothetical protein AAGA85_06165 [Bacteroidota bacterium]